MREFWQGVRRVWGWIDALEVAIPAALALLTLVIGPLVFAGYALHSGRFGIAAAVGLPWIGILGRAGWELGRGRVAPALAGLAILWLILTVVLGSC